MCKYLSIISLSIVSSLSVVRSVLIKKNLKEKKKDCKTENIFSELFFLKICPGNPKFFLSQQELKDYWAYLKEFWYATQSLARRIQSNRSFTA